jgi:hypothetical protein
MNAQRGTMLIEVLLVTAIAWGFTSGDRAFATRSAATIFDAELAHARAIASTSGSPATLVFTPASPGPGVVLSLEPGPDGVPPETLRADVSEVSLGTPPFSLAIDATGHATTSQPCPAAGGFTLTFVAVPACREPHSALPGGRRGPPEPPGTVPP